MSDDEITSRFLDRATLRGSAVRGFDLQQEIEAVVQADEQHDRDVEDIVRQVSEHHPEAGLLVLMGLKAHLDLEQAREEERTGRVYLTKDSDPEDIALAAELELEDDGIDDEDEPDEGDFEG